MKLRAEDYAEFAETQWDVAFRSASERLQRDPSEDEVEAELERMFKEQCDRLEASLHEPRDA